MLDPLTLERMETAAGEGPILIALSGGGDSVALLHLLTERLGAARLRAGIVDHKLREGSGRDAEHARQIAQAAGVASHVLDLTWPADANRAHEAARTLRYAALSAHARKIGARVIAAGHTRDDQAETVLLRASRRSGMRGLAGMRAFAPVPIWREGRGLWLARPLLSARRGELRAYLSARDASWIEDAANENEVYARVRARRVLAGLELDGLDPMRFAALAERLRPHVDRIDMKAAALIIGAAEFRDDEIELDRARWRGEAAVKQRALEALIIAASGEERGPSSAQLEMLAGAIDQSNFTGATLGGAWLQPRRDLVVIRRDPGALSGRAGGAVRAAPVALPPGEEIVWDNRVLLEVREPGWSIAFDGRAPILAKGEASAPLAMARPKWLLRDRASHVLPALRVPDALAPCDGAA